MATRNEYIPTTVVMVQRLQRQCSRTHAFFYMLYFKSLLRSQARIHTQFSRVCALTHTFMPVSTWKVFILSTRLSIPRKSPHACVHIRTYTYRYRERHACSAMRAHTCTKRAQNYIYTHTHTCVHRMHTHERKHTTTLSPTINSLMQTRVLKRAAVQEYSSIGFKGTPLPSGWNSSRGGGEAGQAQPCAIISQNRGDSCF
jgi:hypothetical protein